MAAFGQCGQFYLEAVRNVVPPDPLQSVRQAAAGNWRAAVWLLERTDPQRFAGRATWCQPAQVEDLVSRLIETALEAFPRDDETQLALYVRLNRVAQDCLSMLFPGDRKRFKSRLRTPLSDAQREWADLGVGTVDGNGGQPIMKSPPTPRKAAPPKFRPPATAEKTDKTDKTRASPAELEAENLQDIEWERALLRCK